MKRYSYIEPDENMNPITVVMNEREILDYYWEFWKEKMVKKYGGDHELIINKNCISDWCVTHYATEVEELPDGLV
tara:strand:+ start:684 stop:908 length:225 start_codon:yes stop_codon:yes gene_type:complete